MNKVKMYVYVLSNRVDKRKPSYRHVVVWDYKNNHIFHIVSTKKDEYVTQGCIATNNPDFLNVEKKMIIQLEVDMSVAYEDVGYPYSEGSVEIIKTNINLHELVKKVEKVKQYRVGTLPNESVWGHLGLTSYIKSLKSENRYELVRIKNKRILPDKKTNKFKFLYKIADKKYFGFIINEDIDNTWIEKDFLGYAVLRKIPKEYPSVTCLIGGIVTEKGKNRMYSNDKNTVEKTVLLNTKLNNELHLEEEKREWLIFKEILKQFLGGKVNQLSFYIEQEKPEDIDIRDEIYNKFPTFKEEEFREVYLINKDSVRKSIMERQGIYEITKEVWEEHVNKYNKLLGQYLNGESFFISDNSEVYSVDDFDDIEFPDNLEIITLKEKVKLESGRKLYNDLKF